MPEGVMNPPGEELLDDEYLDDPITLIDYEQARINAIWQEAENSKSKEVEPVQKKNHFVLPVTFFDVPSNLKLLNYCCPLSIKVVDCDKFPWYYKKYKRNLSLPSDEIIVIEDDLIDNEIGIAVKMDVNKITFYPNTLSGTGKKSGPLSQKILQIRSEHRKRRDEVEKNKAIGQKNISKVDFKKNMGLIGLKVTRTIIQDDNVVYKKKSRKRTKQDSIDKSTVDKYILDVDTVLYNVGTSIVPVINNEENKLLGDNVSKTINQLPPGENNKINLLGTEFDKKKCKRSSNKPKKKKKKSSINDSKKIPEPSKISHTETLETTAISLTKVGDVKDKRKTNKYLNDLLKKKIKALSDIKSLKKLKEKHKSTPKHVTTSNLTVIKKYPEEHLHGVITPNVKVDSGIKSPVLPCKINICNKYTPQNSLSNSKLITLKDKLIENINKLKEIPDNVCADNKEYKNQTTEGHPLNTIEDINGSIKDSSVKTQSSAKKDIKNICSNKTSFEIAKNTTSATNLCTNLPPATSKVATDSETSIATPCHRTAAKNNDSTVQQTHTILSSDFQFNNMHNGISKSINGTKSSNNSNNHLHNIVNNVHNVKITSIKPVNNVNNKVNNLPVITFASSNKKISKYVPPNQRKKKNSQSSFPIQTLVSNRPDVMTSEIELVQKAPVRFKAAIPHYHPVQPIFQPNIVTKNLTRCPNDCMLTYQKKANISQRTMPPLVNVQGKDMYMPYWYPPLPPPPPPPPPPRETMQPQYTTQYLPCHPSNYQGTNQNAKLNNCFNLGTTSTNIDTIDTHTLPENKPTLTSEANLKVVSSKTEMLEELEKEMLSTYYDNNCEENPAIKINNVSRISGDTNAELKFPVAMKQKIFTNLRDHKMFPKKCQLDVQGLISDKTNQNRGSSSTSGKADPINKPVIEMRNICNYSGITNQNTNATVLSNNSIEKHINLNKSGSLLIGTKINTFHHKICPTKPRIGPSSKMNKRNVTQIDKTGPAKELKSNGYSPPILPIPSYGTTLEMLSRLNEPVNNLYGLNVKKFDRKILHTQFNSEITPHRNTCKKKNNRDSNDKAAKKISLEEYKKRTLKPEFRSDVFLEEPPLALQCKRNRKDQITTKSVQSLSGIVNHDQDLGYDSDTTVKL